MVARAAIFLQSPLFTAASASQLLAYTLMPSSGCKTGGFPGFGGDMGGMPGRPGKVDNSRYYDLLGELEVPWRSGQTGFYTLKVQLLSRW